MTKKMMLFTFLVLIIAVYKISSFSTSMPADSANSIDEPSLNNPILITSIGQSIDFMMLEKIFDEHDIEYDGLTKASSDDLVQYQTLIIVVGASEKGMNYSDMTLKQEFKRIEDITHYHDSSDLEIVLVHMGGKNRRGEFSDKMIKQLFPISDMILVVEHGDYDGIFSDYAHENNIWYANPKNINALKDIFGTFKRDIE